MLALLAKVVEAAEAVAGWPPAKELFAEIVAKVSGHGDALDAVIAKVEGMGQTIAGLTADVSGLMTSTNERLAAIEKVLSTLPAAAPPPPQG